MKNIALIIPSRLNSTRLPQKPLAKIGSMTMIEHVVLAGIKSGIESVYVATDSADIANLAEERGAKAIITNQECVSGTDRVFLAAQLADLPHEVIINLQGDMPFVDPQVIAQVGQMCANGDWDITTAVAPAKVEYAKSSSNVKAIVDQNGRALYFSRSMIPYNALEYLCHIGIYAFKKEALQKFCSLPMSAIEKAESLEQLRALDNGMTIGACRVADMPISVDTPEDLANAIAFFHQIN
jgi:3-deoxy-manno-octulosonate cytidylyltransferase (CMP-KDO synthetase)